MIRIRRFLSNKEYKVIASNSVYLILIKGATYLIPLIIIPYLLKVIGTENYGRYVLAFSVIQYLLIFVEYGFQFSGTKSIANIGNNEEKLSNIFSAILYARIILAIASCLILVIIGLILNTDFILYLNGCGIILGTAFLPLWLFQGKEKMQFVTIVAIIPKIVTVILIFIFVKNKQDYPLLTLFDSVGYLISGFVGLIVAKIIFKVKFRLFDYVEIKTQLVNGWQVFLSTVMISFYRQANTIILSIVGNYTLVGYYSVAEKLVKAIQSISAPITQAIFPYFSRKLNVKENRRIFQIQFIHWGRIFALGFIVLSVAIMLFSYTIVKLYLGEGYDQVSKNLFILSPVIVFGFMNYYFGIIGLMNMGYQKYFNKAIVFAAIFNIVSCFTLGYFFKDIGASISLLLAEALLMSIIIYYLWWVLKINFFNFFRHKSEPV